MYAITMITICQSGICIAQCLYRPERHPIVLRSPYHLECRPIILSVPSVILGVPSVILGVPPVILSTYPVIQNAHPVILSVPSVILSASEGSFALKRSNVKDVSLRST